jgi:hypothetical protein
MAVNYSLRYTFVSFLIAAARAETKAGESIGSEGDVVDERDLLVDIDTGHSNLSQLDHLFLDESAPQFSPSSLLRYFTGEERTQREEKQSELRHSSGFGARKKDAGRLLERLLKQFMNFLGSDDYMKFIYANVMRGPIDKRATCMSDPFFERRYAQRALVGRDARLDLLFGVFSKSGTDILDDALDGFDREEMDYLRRSGNGRWLKSLLVSVEELSLSVTILSSDSDTDYPFIYCNKEFQLLSGHHRHNIIGQPFHFLRGSPSVMSNTTGRRTNESRWKKMIKAFEICCPVSVSVTNCKKNGTLFSSIISCKPIYDRMGTQRYIICVHYEKKGGNERTEKDDINEIKLVSDLLSTLPNLLDT